MRQRASPLIERIEITNNQFLQRETLLFYVSSKPGDPYDERKLRDDFKRLWDTGFLDDLRIEAVDGPRGKIVSFVVTERKRIQIVDYRGSKDAHHQHDRGRAQEARRPDQDRHLLRPGEGPQGRGDHQGDAGGQGPALRAPSSTRPRTSAPRASSSRS